MKLGRPLRAPFFYAHTGCTCTRTQGKVLKNLNTNSKFNKVLPRALSPTRL